MKKIRDKKEHREVWCFIESVKTVDSQKAQKDGSRDYEDCHHDGKGGIGSLLHGTRYGTWGLDSIKGTLLHLQSLRKLLGFEVHEGLEYNGKSASHPNAHHKPKGHQGIAQDPMAFLLNGAGWELDNKLEPSPNSKLERDDTDKCHHPRDADENFHNYPGIFVVAKWTDNSTEFVDGQHPNIHPTSRESYENKRAKNLASDASNWPVMCNAGHDYSNTERNGQDDV